MARFIALICVLICISSSLKNFAYAEKIAATTTKDPSEAKAQPGTPGNSKFVVHGHVYCDTCRVEFETSLSQPISGATVKLECRNRANGQSTYTSPDITTDGHGDYSIEVEGDYEDSDCDVALVKSPLPDCNDPTEEWRKARVVLTTLDGVDGENRFANNLGFKKKDALPDCHKVLEEMGYYELQQEVGEPAAP